MSVDLTTVPWNRLKRLAPPGAKVDELQEAADRWALTADVYNAAADMWEERGLLIDTAPDCDETSTEGSTERKVASVSQDGISITYADDALSGNNQSTRIAQVGQINAIVRRLRAKGKVKAPLVHDPDYDAWTGHFKDECETIIVVDEV